MLFVERWLKKWKLNKYKQTKKKKKERKMKNKKNRTNPATWRGKYRKEIFYLFWSKAIKNWILFINFNDRVHEVTKGLRTPILSSSSFYFIFVMSASNPHWRRINKRKEKAAPSACQRQIPWHQSTGTKIIENPSVFKKFSNSYLSIPREVKTRIQTASGSHKSLS